jgi:hypothetical protein
MKKQLLRQGYTDCIEVKVVEAGEKFSGTTPLFYSQNESFNRLDVVLVNKNPVFQGRWF